MILLYGAHSSMSSVDSRVGIGILSDSISPK
jgi:hypothetical protein